MQISKELFKGVESFMGYLPNAHLTMAEKPELLIAFSNLANTIFQAGGIDLQTKQLIALATSLSLQDASIVKLTLLMGLKEQE